MTNVPFDGRLDLHVACLLVAERHSDLVGRSVTAGDVADVVLELIDHLDVDADDLTNLDEFEEAIEEAMDELVAVSWVKRRRYASVLRYTAGPAAADAIRWIRKRLASRPRRLHDLDELTDEITGLVVERYGSTRAEPAPRS